MLRFAEERRVVRAIVETHHFELVDRGAFQQVERGRGLAEGPQLGDRQAEDAAIVADDFLNQRQFEAETGGFLDLFDLPELQDQLARAIPIVA